MELTSLTFYMIIALAVLFAASHTYLKWKTSKLNYEITIQEYRHEILANHVDNLKTRHWEENDRKVVLKTDYDEEYWDFPTGDDDAQKEDLKRQLVEALIKDDRLFEFTEHYDPECDATVRLGAQLTVLKPKI